MKHLSSAFLIWRGRHGKYFGYFLCNQCCELFFKSDTEMVGISIFSSWYFEIENELPLVNSDYQMITFVRRFTSNDEGGDREAEKKKEGMEYKKRATVKVHLGKPMAKNSTRIIAESSLSRMHVYSEAHQDRVKILVKVRREDAWKFIIKPRRRRRCVLCGVPVIRTASCIAILWKRKTSETCPLYYYLAILRLYGIGLHLVYLLAFEFDFMTIVEWCI